MSWDAWLDHARAQERQAGRVREILEAAAEANVALPATQQALATARSALADLEQAQRSLTAEITVLTSDASAARAVLDGLHAETARAKAQAETDHAARLADLEEEYQRAQRRAEQDHQVALDRHAEAETRLEQATEARRQTLAAELDVLSHRRDDVKTEVDALLRRLGG